MTKTVEVTIKYEITIPDEEIKQILKDYQEVIDTTAEVEDLFKQVAYNEIHLGGELCEGISDYVNNKTNFKIEEIDEEYNVD